jgi:AraC-like DNA-binding protein
VQKTVLIIGRWKECRNPITTFLSSGWSVVHALKLEDITSDLRGNFTAGLISDRTTLGELKNSALATWAAESGTPLIAIGEEDDDAVTALSGAPGLAKAAARAGGIARKIDCAEPVKSVTVYRPVERRVSPEIKRAIDYVNARFAEKISLGDAAAAASYSRCHFCRVFKAQVGMSFVGYVTQVRIRHAMRYLLETDRSISEIAFDVGFNDLSHFERVFRSLTRATPSQYRHRREGGKDGHLHDMSLIH